jgi:PAS domain S-box-containing protein
VDELSAAKCSPGKTAIVALADTDSYAAAAAAIAAGADDVVSLSLTDEQLLLRLEIAGRSAHATHAASVAFNHEPGDWFQGELFENAADIVFIRDLNGNFLALNKRGRELFGFSKEEVLTLRLDDLLDPETRELNQRMRARKLEGDASTTTYELPVRTKDGRLIYVENSSRLIYEGDVPVALHGIARDVTERVEARRRLEEGEARFRTLAETMPSGLIVFRENSILYANAAMERITGYPRDILADRGAWKGVVHPDDFNLAVNTTVGASTADAIANTQYRIIRNDGEVRWVDVNASEITFGGTTAKIAAITDITEQKATLAELEESQARQRSLLDNASELIYATDLSGRLLLANSAWAKSLGHDPRELIGRDASEFLAPASRKGFYERLALRQAGDVSSMSFQMDLPAHDGAIRTFEVEGRPLFIDGEMRGSQGIARDITDRAQAERLLDGQVDILEQIARDRPLAEVLSALTVLAERSAGTSGCCILTLAPDGVTLLLGAAPSLPRQFVDQLEGLQVGPDAGPCGMAAFTGKRVVTADIENDPLWTAFRDLAMEHNLRGSFATPIVSSAGAVLGVLTLYFSIPHEPCEAELRVADALTYLAGIAIERRRERDSLSLLAAIVESSQDAIISQDREGQIMSWNKGAERLYGYTASEVAGKRLDFLEPPGSRGQLHESPGPKLVGERFENIESKRVARDGRLLDVSVSLFPVRDADGEVFSVAGIGRDITEQKRATDALRQAEERFSRIFHASPVAIVISDMATSRVVEVNGRFVEMFGFAPSEAIGRTGRELDIWVDLEHRDEVVGTLSAEHDGARPTLEAEGQVRRKDGAVRDALISVSGVEIGGRPHLVASFVDITPQKEAEIALRESEERLRNLVADVHVGILLVAPDATVLAVNSSALVMLAIREEDFVGRTTSEVLSRSARSMLNEEGVPLGPEQLPIAQAIRTRLPVRNIVVGVSDELHRTTWVLASAEPVLSSSGEVNHVICTLVDITDRKRAEEALRLSEANYRAVVEGTNDAIFAVDRDGEGEFRATFANSAFLRLTGFSLRRMIGRTAAEFMPERYSTAARARYAQCVAAGKSIEYEESFERDGRRFDLVTNLTPLLDERGACYRLVGTSRDVSERLRAEQAAAVAEQRLRTVASNAPIILWAVDADARLTLAEGSGLGALPNGGGMVRLGVSLLDEFVDFPRISADITRGLAGETFSDTVQFGDAWLDTHFTPLLTDDGVVSGLIGVSVNVTERRRAEEALLQAQKMESMGVLAGGIAHDFNNLLVGILGNAGLALAELPRDSSAAPIIHEIETAGQRAADLARQMLAYSGKGRFVIQALDINALVLEMTQLLRVSINRSAVLRNDLASNLPAVEGDATQLRQVVMNLVVNASDALGEAGGSIRVSTGIVRANRGELNELYLAPHLPEGDYIFVEVADSGSGMDAETRARIFDPFFTTKFTGRGLGLAAVLGIVRGHKGAIRVQSEPGNGATFTLLLPKVTTSVRAPVTVPSAPAWTSKGSVLVVDDEETVRTVTGRAIKLFGFTPILASDGQEGVDLFREHQDEVVCVLLDMTMPRLNGEDAFVLIRQIRPDARVILTSGYAEHDATARFVDKGLAGFIQKPYELSTLRGALRAAIEGSPGPDYS